MELSIHIRIERWPVGRLIVRITNPRIHSDRQIDQIAQSIREFGFVNPVLVGPDDVIIAGHASLLAARQLGLAEVPVIVLRNLSAAQRRALAIADNQLALGAEWDEDLLRSELAALQEEDFNLDLMGFDDVDLTHLLAADGTIMTAWACCALNARSTDTAPMARRIWCVWSRLSR